MSDGQKKTLEELAEDRPALRNKVMLLNGFDYQEISAIMKAVKALFPNPRELIFAKSTPTNLEMRFGEIIEDISEDHAYLMANPPMRRKAELKEAGLRVPAPGAQSSNAQSSNAQTDSADRSGPGSSDGKGKETT